MSTPSREKRNVMDWCDQAAERIWDAFLEYDSDERNSMSAGDVAALIREAYAAQPRPGIQARAEAAAQEVNREFAICVSPPQYAERRETEKTLTDIIASRFSDLEPQVELRLAVEFGFRCHEKGMNLEATLAALDKAKGE